MKMNRLVNSVIICSAIFLTGCATSDIRTIVSDGTVVSTSDHKLAPTNPKFVKLYFGNSGIPKHYQVIGHVSADNYSMVAMTHSQEAIAEELKKQAASIGGTGVMNIATGLDRTTGDVFIAK